MKKTRSLQDPTALVDPFQIIDRRLRVTARRETSAVRAVSLPYEIQMTPPPGASVSHLTVAGSYREPVPILYDFDSRTAYPMSSGE